MGLGLGFACIFMLGDRAPAGCRDATCAGRACCPSLMLRTARDRQGVHLMRFGGVRLRAHRAAWRAQACPARLLQIHHLLVLEPGELDLDVGVICPLVVEIGLHELGVGVGVDRETLVRPLECSVVGIVYASQLAGVTFAVRSDPHTTGTPGVVVSVRHPASSAAVHRHFVLQCGESVLP